ncbi:MAG TPA: adenosine kinase [Ferrovibrio sp.]|uniref:adenosine kinase n=1 Tax=Ferrovibrio sp. TaxID=1917215 RepID=UPI002ED5139A
MADKPFQLLALGNAIVDVLARVDNDFLDENGMTKGSMALIDGGRAEQLYGSMGETVECSGGSAANTAAGFAALGGKVQFIGRVRNDPLGEVFIRDIRGLGVHYDTPPATDGPSTARCLIMVTPDAQRTMNTYLGASIDLSPDDVEPAAVAQAEITYLEGYLWDQPQAKDAMRKAMRLAHDAGGKVAMTLSDSFCVDRHRAEFRHLVEHHIDILFANEAEIKSLFETQDFDEALQHVHHHVDIAVLTRSEKGSVILADGAVHIIDAIADVNVIDTTGAGDLYAAGFLYGFAHGFDPHACGRLGSHCAAEVISHIGPRPQKPLKPFIDLALQG